MLEGGVPADPSSFQVTAGVVSLNPGADTTQLQQVGVSAIARHPGYIVLPLATDDVAVLTLSTPLTFGGPAVAPIARVAINKTPALGTTVTAYGWGETVPGSSDGYERSLTEKVTDVRTCFTGRPSVLCAQISTGSICPGDSGSGLVVDVGSKPVLVGVTQGAEAIRSVCAPNQKNIYEDLSSPEIALWLNGSKTPPRAPRGDAFLLFTIPQNRIIRCMTPSWTGKPKVTVEFIDLKTNAVLARGTYTYQLRPAQLGHKIECLQAARNSGGTSYAASLPFTVTRAALSKKK